MSMTYYPSRRIYVIFYLFYESFSLVFPVVSNKYILCERKNVDSETNIMSDMDGYGFPAVEDIPLHGTIKVESLFENTEFDQLQHDIYEKTVRKHCIESCTVWA